MNQKWKNDAQATSFTEGPRALDADEDEAAFKTKPEQIARQPIAHEVTRAERKALDAARAAEQPVAQRTREGIAADLVEAEAALAAAQVAFDRYNGNNPNKYRSRIKFAAARVALLKSEAGRVS